MPFFNCVQPVSTMTSKLDGSYHDNGRRTENSSYKKGEDNFYYSTSDYCGLATPSPLEDRNSALTYQSGSGYHDRRRHEGSRESRERTDHIRRSNIINENNDNDHPQTSTRLTNNDHPSSSTQRHHRDRDDHVTSSRTRHSSFNAAVIVDQPRPMRDTERHDRVNTGNPVDQPRPMRDTERHDNSANYPPRSRVNTGNPVSTIDSNMNKVKGKHPALKPPDIQILADHAVSYNNSNNRQPPISPRIKELKVEDRATRTPGLGVAFPRPHSVDVPEKKSQIKRTFSAPELRASNSEKHSNDDRNLNNAKDSQRHVRYDPPLTHAHTSSKGNIAAQGARSKSLPSVSLPRNFKLKTQSTRDTDPLRYFAYLGKRFQFRERLPSAHNVLSSRPVILTSTSVISPEVSNTFRDQLEDYDGSQKYQGACQDLIDCCTCMCCVKAVFYHCTKDDYTEGEVAEHPCSCSKPVGQCLVRWSVLGLFSACLPCLLCYFPIQGCKRGVDYFRRKDDTDT